MNNARRLILIVFGILIGVAAVVFVLGNKTPVTITFLWVESVEIWLSLVLLAAAVLGAALGLSYAAWLALSHRRTVKRLNRRIADLHDELTAHRNRFIDDPGLFPPTGNSPPTRGERR